MDITIADFTEDDRKKLEYIQQETDSDLQASISAAIDAYYHQLHEEHDPLARLKQSPLIGSFHGDPNLSEQSEDLFHSLIRNEE